MFGFKLADLIVELTAKGMDTLKAALGGVREELEEVSQVAEQARDSIEAVAAESRGMAAFTAKASGFTDALKDARQQADFFQQAIRGASDLKTFDQIISGIDRVIGKLNEQKMTATAVTQAQRDELAHLMDLHLQEQAAFSKVTEQKKLELAELKKAFQAAMRKGDPLHGVESPIKAVALGFGELKKLAGVPEEMLSRIKALSAELKNQTHPGLEAIEKDIKRLQQGLASGGALGQLQAMLDRFGLLRDEAIKGRDKLTTFAGINFGALHRGLEKAREHIGRLTVGLTAFSGIASRAFLVAQTSLLGFIFAGLRGTSVGEAMGVRMTLLSRQIAAIFLPQIMKVVDWLGKLVLWFQRLTGHQQASLRRWILFGVALAGTLALMPLVAAGIQMVVNQLYNFAAAFTTAASSTGIGALLPVIGAIIAGLLALTVGLGVAGGGFERLARQLRPILDELSRAFGDLMEEAEPILVGLSDLIANGLVVALKMVTFQLQQITSAIKGIKAAWDQLPPAARGALAGAMAALGMGKTKKEDKARLDTAGGQFEGFQDTWRRMQSAAFKPDMAKSEAQKTAENTAEIARQQRETNRRLDRLNPAVAA